MKPINELLIDYQSSDPRSTWHKAQFKMAHTEKRVKKESERRILS